MKHIFLPVLIIVLIALGGYIVFTWRIPPSVGPSSTPQQCTLEAKLCPDGTAVGRTGPNCEFAPCPPSTSSGQADETAGWLTYRNEEYGFEVKYPEGWPVPIEGGGPGPDGGAALVGSSNFSSFSMVLGSIARQLCEGEDCYTYGISVLTNARDAGAILSNLESRSLENGGLVTITNDSYVNGSRTIVYTEGGICESKNAFIFGQQYTVKFISFCNDITTDKFDQILSTFRFTK